MASCLGTFDEAVRCLLRVAKSNEGYALLHGDSWSSGGCWDLAEALHRRLSLGRLFVLRGRAQWGTVDVPQHVLLRVAGMCFVDADGPRKEPAVLKFWQKTEMITNPRIVPLEDVEGEVRRAGIELHADVVSGLFRLWDRRCPGHAGLAGLFGRRP